MEKLKSILFRPFVVIFIEALFPSNPLFAHETFSIDCRDKPEIAGYLSYPYNLENFPIVIFCQDYDNDRATRLQGNFEINKIHALGLILHIYILSFLIICYPMIFS